MSGFAAVLREEVASTRRSLEAAQSAGQPFEVHLHSARLLDLLDRAQRNAVDTAGWVPEAELSVAASNCA
jgi:hypothetical protein